MPSLQRFSSNGRYYYRLVESHRVNGKPRPVPILYLGAADQIVQRLQGSPAMGPLRLRSFEHGSLAALKSIADELGVVSIIDQFVPVSRHKLSVGTTLLLAAINRAIRPRSKMGWARWAQDTSIEHLFPLRVEDITSQYFWDQMDLVSLPALEKIEDALTQKIVSTLQLPLDILFYDPTNFFTYISSTNNHCDLPQRGKSKQHRHDLRQFSVALMVSRLGGIPLCSHVYAGNIHDSVVFPDSLTAIRQRLERLAGPLQEITLVYDKGNNSKTNQALIDQQQWHYVGSLDLSYFPDLLAIPSSAYQPFTNGPLKDLLFYRWEREIWGAKRTLVLLISEQLRAGQIRGLKQHLDKRLHELQTWREALAKPRSKRLTPEIANKKIRSLTEGQYIAQVLKVTYHPECSGTDQITWAIDDAVYQHLVTEVFGKRLLMTDRSNWLTEEIIQAYRGQSHAEEVFRQLKDPEHLAIRPQYHWTDQKIRVHTFLVLMGFLLCRVLQWRARQAGYTQNLSSLIDLLSQVRLALIVRSHGRSGGRPVSHWQLEDAPQEAMQLFRLLVPQKPPFVYTFSEVTTAT